jgi:hypothetical protein
LRGSPTVSPMTAALWQSEPLPPRSRACSVAPAWLEREDRGAGHEVRFMNCVMDCVRRKERFTVCTDQLCVMHARSRGCNTRHIMCPHFPCTPLLCACASLSCSTPTALCWQPPPLVLLLSLPHLDVLLGIVPGAAGVAHGHRHLHAADQRPRQHARQGAGAKQHAHQDGRQHHQRTCGDGEAGRKVGGKVGQWWVETAGDAWKESTQTLVYNWGGLG